MKRLLPLLEAALGVLWFLPAGCIKTSDEDAIRSLLAGSAYTSDNHARSYGSDDSTPTGGGNTDVYDTIPFVRFRRYIPPGGISRTVKIDIPAYPGYSDTTALATITATINGEFRTIFDSTTNPMHIWRKPFVDEAVRKVYLNKDKDRWRIRKVTPLEFSTVDAPYELKLTEIMMHASSWPDGDTFRLETADTLLAKDELPIFAPEDTVWVRVSVSSTGDSSWVFLHHGRPQGLYHWRRPYCKTSTTTFERFWYIGLESAGVSSEVRPSGHDAIGWSTLWGDTSSPYVAATWGVPYIIHIPGTALPED